MLGKTLALALVAAHKTVRCSAALIFSIKLQLTGLAQAILLNQMPGHLAFGHTKGPRPAEASTASAGRNVNGGGRPLSADVVPDPKIAGEDVPGRQCRPAGTN